MIKNRNMWGWERDGTDERGRKKEGENGKEIGKVKEMDGMKKEEGKKETAKDTDKQLR